jgi:uncharacterized protein (UPF0333 family)
MKYLLGYSKLVGLGVTIFVVLAGALGYTYISHINAEVATNKQAEDARAVAQKAATATAPTVASTADLDTAMSTLDTVSNDANLDADMATIDAADIDF